MFWLKPKVYLYLMTIGLTEPNKKGDNTAENREPQTVMGGEVVLPDTLNSSVVKETLLEYQLVPVGFEVSLEDEIENLRNTIKEKYELKGKQFVKIQFLVYNDADKVGIKTIAIASAFDGTFDDKNLMFNLKG